MDALVKTAVAGMLDQTDHAPPHRAILGCTHYPLVEHLFRRHLPAFTRVLSQPEVVADSFEDYLARKPQYVADSMPTRTLTLLTTGDPKDVSPRAHIFWPEAPQFSRL